MIARLAQLAGSDRRHERRATLTIAVMQSLGERRRLCQADNISRSGMLLSAVYDGSLPLRTRCWVEFSLPGSDQTIPARVEVVRELRDDRYQLLAVRFATIAPSHRRLIETYVAQAGA